MCYGYRASRKLPIGQSESAQNEVTASFGASFRTRVCAKSDENRVELRGQIGKAQFS